ncbi:MAG: hypothetical protein WCK98_06255 [bacterium]
MFEAAVAHQAMDINILKPEIQEVRKIKAGDLKQEPTLNTVSFEQASARVIELWEKGDKEKALKLIKYLTEHNGVYGDFNKLTPESSATPQI